MSMFEVAEKPKAPKVKKEVLAAPAKPKERVLTAEVFVEDPPAELPAEVHRTIKAINKMLDRELMVKRSVLINTITAKLYPAINDEDAEMSKEDEAACFNNVSAVLDGLIETDTVQEFEFSRNGDVIESMIVNQSLALDIDLGEALPGLDDEEDDETPISGLLSDSEADDLEDTLFSGSDDKDDQGPDLYDPRTALNAFVSQFAVVAHRAGDRNPAISLHHDPAGALAEYSEAAKHTDVGAELFGLIPISMKVELDFVAPSVAPIQEDGPLIAPPEQAVQVPAPLDIDLIPAPAPVAAAPVTPPAPSEAGFE